MNCYILFGRLYANQSRERLSVRKTADGAGEKAELLFDDVRPSGEVDKHGFSEYYPYSGGDRILFDDGCYELIDGGDIIPVWSLSSRRVHDMSKLTVSDNEQWNGKVIPFCDKAYAVCENGGAPFEYTIVHSNGELPKILLDGNTEEVAAGDKTTQVSVTYPVDDDADALRHMDCLELLYNGEVIRQAYWDQLSKVWFAAVDGEKTEMVAVKGGKYTMGDWRGLQYNYSFGANNVNMKKTWLNVLDPQFMGENERGEKTVGVSGLRPENSSAKENTSTFWAYNEDSVTLHEVGVSDFMLGKYQVTMEQYYRFVNELEIVSPTELCYNCNGEKITLNELASFVLYYKKLHPRDNGWGLGQRPAIDISRNEATEYCNWLSRREGLEVCYTYEPIFEGKHAAGKTKLKMLKPVKGSSMQKTVEDAELQLYFIRCDFGKNGYRLPCEAETEYAMRGGEYMSGINGGHGCLFAGMTVNAPQNNVYYSWMRKNVDNPQKNGSNAADAYRNNHGGNGYTGPVGCKIPNQLGIYDMSGNVWEVQWDTFNRAYYEDCAAAGFVQNPRGPEFSAEQLSIMDGCPTDRVMSDEYEYKYEQEADGSFRRVSAMWVGLSGKSNPILRGGCFTNPLPFTSSVHRHTTGRATYYFNINNTSNARMGFRLARSIPKGDGALNV